MTGAGDFGNKNFEELLVEAATVLSGRFLLWGPGCKVKIYFNESMVGK